MSAAVRSVLSCVLLRVLQSVLPVGGVHGFAVVSPSGKVAGSPDVVQSIAREDASTPDHSWPKQEPASSRMAKRVLI